jgi:hypothetical protein
MQFQWNFTGLICSSSPYAYCTGFPVEWFWPSYGPLIKRCFFLCVARYAKSLSGLLLINYWCNFIQTLQEWSVPSLVVHCMSVCPSVTKFDPTWNWPSCGDTCDYWSLLLRFQVTNGITSSQILIVDSDSEADCPVMSTVSYDASNNLIMFFF